MQPKGRSNAAHKHGAAKGAQQCRPIKIARKHNQKGRPTLPWPASHKKVPLLRACIAVPFCFMGCMGLARSLGPRSPQGQIHDT